MKNKKKGSDKETWIFDARLDGMINFASKDVLKMAKNSEFLITDRIQFTRIVYDNLMEAILYAQARPKDYSIKKVCRVIEKILKKDLMLTVEALANEVSLGTNYREEMDSEDTIKGKSNPYNPMKIDYSKILTHFYDNEPNPNFPDRFFNLSADAIHIKSTYSGIAARVVDGNRTFTIIPNTEMRYVAVEVPIICKQLWEYGSSLSKVKTELTSERIGDITSISDLNVDISTVIHTPYQPLSSLTASIRYLMHNAAFKVTVIDMTLYRIEKNSEFIDLIIEASKQGIHCCVFMELKATGELYNDMKNLNRLFNEGDRDYIHLSLNYSNVKVHGKVIYVDYIPALNNPDNITRTLSVISTGNYNMETAKVYTDYHYITNDVSVSKMVKRNFETLWDDSQQYLSSISSIIIKEIYAECAKGKDGRIWLQTNHLDNKRIVKALRDAKRRGVDVKLIVRTTKGFHKKQLKCKTVTGHNLEHARLYIFGKYDRRVYISSSDLLFRNLYNRFETYLKIPDPGFADALIADFSELYHLGQAKFSDDITARREYRSKALDEIKDPPDKKKKSKNKKKGK